jgi:succinate dehydrogenase / fumarate reductase cytochrome b subunit
MNKTNRPLSPHLSIYRWPITMILSILHRFTGVTLSVGLIILMIWLVALSTGTAAYEYIATLMQTVVGRLLLVSFSFMFFFHLCNGVRHLFWDVGKGFDIHHANISAWLVVLTTIILTLGLWLGL